MSECRMMTLAQFPSQNLALIFFSEDSDGESPLYGICQMEGEDKFSILFPFEEEEKVEAQLVWNAIFFGKMLPEKLENLFLLMPGKAH